MSRGTEWLDAHKLFWFVKHHQVLNAQYTNIGSDNGLVPKSDVIVNLRYMRHVAWMNYE